MAARFDIPLLRNEVWRKRLTLSDESGALIDLTGWSFALHVRSRVDNDTLIAAATFDLTEVATGAITPMLSAIEGTPLNGYGSPLQTENLPYDLRAVDPAGDKLVLAAGMVILSRGVTHD